MSFWIHSCRTLVSFYTCVSIRIRRDRENVLSVVLTKQKIGKRGQDIIQRSVSASARRNNNWNNRHIRLYLTEELPFCWYSCLRFVKWRFCLSQSSLVWVAFCAFSQLEPYKHMYIPCRHIYNTYAQCAYVERKEILKLWTCIQMYVCLFSIYRWGTYVHTYIYIYWRREKCYVEAENSFSHFPAMWTQELSAVCGERFCHVRVVWSCCRHVKKTFE